MKQLSTPLEYAKSAIATMLRRQDEGLMKEEKQSFNYHMGVFLCGIYQNYLLYAEEAWFTFIKDWVDSLVDEEGKIHGVFRNRLDDFQAGNLLYPLYERTKEARYKLALDHLMELMDAYPKNREGGFWHMERFPNQMWLDGLYMGGPLICKYAAMFGVEKYYDIAAEQALLMQEKTRDEATGLWYHAYDCERTADWADKQTGCSPEFWGRSMGWVPIAVLEELDYIAESHPQYPALCRLVQELLIALCRFQAEDGRWYQVVNKGGEDHNWLENSCSCLYSAAICKAVRKGLMDQSYLIYAKKGYEGVINSLTWDGEDLQVGNVCVGTGVGDYEHYCNRPVCVNDLHGVGALLIMCAEMQRTCFTG